MSNPWDNDPIVQPVGARTPLAPTDPLFIQEAMPIETVPAMPWDNDPIVTESPQDPEATAWEQFKYAFDKAQGITSYAADVIEKYVPLGRLTFDFTNGFEYYSPSETYGEEFKDATPDQRRELIFQNHQKFLENEYGSDMQATGAPAFLGEVVKGLADPTTLLPLGQTYKAMAATSAGLGSLWSVLQDTATVGEVDPLKALTIGAASGVLAPATVFGVRALIKPVQTRGAQKVMTEAQEALNDRAAKGYTITDIPQALQEEGVDLVRVARAQQYLNTELQVPVAANPGEEAIKRSVVDDSAVSRLYSPALDKYLGTLATRVRNISEPVFGRLRRFEFNTHIKTQQKLQTVKPFLDEVVALPRVTKDAVARHLYNGEFDAARGVMRAVLPKMSDDFDVVLRELDTVGDDLIASGNSFEKVANYFPRVVKDLDGLLNSLGKEKQGKITRAIADYAKAKEVSPSSLPTTEKAEIIDLVLRGYRMTTDQGKPRFLQQRTVESISPDQLKFYASPEESLSTYLRGAVNNIEKRAFFGRAAQDSAGRLDADSSVGRFVADELENIPQDKQDELASLLMSRFVNGESTPSSTVSLIRNLGYMGTIANPISATVQLADIGVTAFKAGLRNTVKSLFGAKDVKLIDIGIDQVISQEFSDPSIANKVLNKLFGVSGFRAIDTLGKETFIGAALRKNTALANNAKGVEVLRSKWGKTFGDSFDSVVADLRAGQLTEDVKFLLFNELADIQPITLSEMPQAYLDNPNGRILYMLKSFTLKQYDIARREVVQQWSKGNKMEAVKNATRLAGYMAAANLTTSTIKDFLLGRDIPPENLPKNAMWALLGVYGLNEYTNERYLQRGDIKGALVNQLVPATPIFDAAFTLGTELPKDDPNIASTLRAIPLVGPLVYAWFGGGAEKHNERLAEQQQ